MTAIGAAPPRAIGTRTGTRIKSGSADAPEAIRPRAPAAGLIARDALVDRLVEAQATSLALLVAPAGYGKTTALAAWAARDSRPFAWVQVNRVHDDPLELARAIAAAVTGIPQLRGPLEAAGVQKRRRSPDALARSLEQAFASAPKPFVLVLDDGHLLHHAEAFDLLERLAESMGPGSQIALATRRQPPLPVARLRTERRLFELGASDLALTRDEVAEVAAAAGLALDSSAAELLAERTEGWPAAAYLAALALRDEPSPKAALQSFGGDDRLIVDYVREELLSELPGHLIEFLARTSVLPRLSGPLCDHVLGRGDSVRVLRRLAQTNLPLVPLDRTGTEYRYNALFAEALRSELRLREPELECELHSRASDWHANHGEPGAAIEHALEAHDLERAGALLWSAAPEMLGYGQTVLLARRLARFSREQLSAFAPLALSSAIAQLALGDRALADHWATTAERLFRDDPGAHDAEVEAGLHILRAAVGEYDVAGMRDQAERAYELAADDSAWKPAACLLAGTARRLAGNHDAAQRCLEEGARRGVALAPAMQVLCLAELALLAIDDGDWEGAQTRTAIARAQIERVGLEDFPLSALVYAVSAAINAHMARPQASDRDARHADRLLAELPGFSPWYSTECRIALASAAVRLSESTRARELLAAAARDLHELPDAVAARSALCACQEQIDVHSAARADDAEELTTAELRVLQFLPTHLSFPEIADELYVSRNTVKTHVRAVYRKLTATSRSEAVQHARQAGLLDKLAA
ncbi:MAG TPA: LuxR C-terminal-related transcriptional regulator [Thermoleophilaceae bacterium]|nr:LuxR C-terminal-related transcriptional regulator [Thermoleophilaceae bacterium]